MYIQSNNMMIEILKEMFQEAGLAMVVCLGILVAARFMKPEEDTKF